MSNWGEFPQNWPNHTGKYAKLHRLMANPCLPSGEWRMIANGRIYQLNIVDGEIDPKSGPGSTSDPLINITTVWERGGSGTSLRVAFRRHIRRGTKPDVIQEWIGYMMTSPLDADGAFIDEKYRIAGTYERIDESGQNSSGGWYATIDRADVRKTDETFGAA